MKPRIAIIGAGMSGLTIAHQLKDTAEITLFEKARGVGGRMSTRYADPFYFDHGTQFFTARSDAFKTFLKPFIEAGTVAEWQGKVINLTAGEKPTKRLWFEPHWVASPNMNSLCKKLAEGLDIKLSTEIAPLTEKTDGSWHLHSKEGTALGAFDWVLSTAPPAQTQRLFAAALPADAPFPDVTLQGCYTLMLGYDKPWDKSWIAAKISDSPLEWIAVNSSKPGRNTRLTTLVVHSRNDWADAHIDDDMAEAQQYLLTEFEKITGIDSSKAEYCAAHRWKYAIVQREEAGSFFHHPTAQLSATGDWPTASRIEDSWLNAVALAHAVNKEIAILNDRKLPRD